MRAVLQQRSVRKHEHSSCPLLCFWRLLVFFFQVLLGRKYIVESCGYSDIFQQSPLQYLRLLPFFMALLDQCACGGHIEGHPIRKRTHFQGSHVFHYLHVLCPGGHQHMNLRGCLPARSAQYPEAECERIALDGLNPPDAPEAVSYTHLTLPTKA